MLHQQVDHYQVDFSICFLFLLIEYYLGTGSIASPDDEILNLIKYLKENMNRLQILTQKFTNESKA